MHYSENSLDMTARMEYSTCEQTSAATQLHTEVCLLSRGYFCYFPLC